jgi:hypothetical protein
MNLILYRGLHALVITGVSLACFIVSTIGLHKVIDLNE